MTQVHLQSLTKRYGEVRAVNSISLDVADGHFISLLGPSGCGKTTTLKCIAGFEHADEGRILFDGRDISGLPPEKRDIGMVFQSYALFPHMTVARNLAFGLEMRKRPRAEIEERVAKVLEMVQMVHLRDRYPRELSGGQQQRTALARALVIQPSILLLDEPLANLDAKLRDEMRTFIRDLQQRVGITTLYVTHDQAEAMTMSDRVVVMFEGRIAQVGAPEEIYDRPADRHVAAFVGQSNFIDGVVAAHAGGPCLTGPFGRVPLGAMSAVDGSAMTLLARPESIDIGPASDSADAKGTIDARYYLGSYIDYRVRLADDQVVTVHGTPPARFSPGDAVGLSFDPERLWAVDR